MELVLKRASESGRESKQLRELLKVSEPGHSSVFGSVTGSTLE